MKLMMRLVFGLLILCFATFAYAQDDGDDAVPDDVQWKGMSDFVNKIRNADVSQEFGTVLLDAEPLYQAATRFEWRRAIGDSAGRSFPFLLCKTTPDASSNEAETSSGYELKTSLRATLLVVTATSTTIRTMVNTNDLYCAVARLKAVTAIVVARSGWDVQPLLSSMKLLPDSIEEIERRLGADADDDDDDAPLLSIDIILCPEVEANSEVTTRSSETLKDFSLHEPLAWWRNANLTTNGPRQAFWETVLADGVENGACNEIVANRLVWDYFPSTSSADGTITLTFDNSNATTVDKVCALDILASLIVSPSVCTVETRKPTQTRNKNAQWLIQTGIDSERPWFDAAIMGSGQIVAVSDTGIDANNCYFADAIQPGQFRNEEHRKIVQYVPFADNVDQKYGHGTHVVGTVLASRNPDDPNNGMVPGIAPEAKVAFLDIGLPSGVLSTPSSDFQICQTGRDSPDSPKAKVHSASWGSVGVSGYTIQTRNFDQYMFENDDFLMVIAAGNDGDNDTPFTVSAPATAKNIISVGASHSCCGDLSPGQLGPNHIASFSSRGPTADGRTKPDVVAPGRYILSTAARPDSPGSCDPNKAPGASGESGGVLSLAGTSMATPVVSGSAALVRQYFEQGFYPTGEKVDANAFPDPSGALIKAVLMNGAQYLDSVDNGKSTTKVNPYDNAQNFGRISFIDSLYLKGKTNVQAEVWDRQPISRP
jgi:subtilisin family serine protease